MLRHENGTWTATFDLVAILRKICNFVKNIRCAIIYFFNKKSKALTKSYKKFRKNGGNPFRFNHYEPDPPDDEPKPKKDKKKKKKKRNFLHPTYLGPYTDVFGSKWSRQDFAAMPACWKTLIAA